MPNSDPPSRNQLATDIRSYALRLFWFNQKTKSDEAALAEARKLLVAATMYEQMLSEEIEGGSSSTPTP
jgi:hypothetical protein